MPELKMPEMAWSGQRVPCDLQKKVIDWPCPVPRTLGLKHKKRLDPSITPSDPQSIVDFRDFREVMSPWGLRYEWPEGTHQMIYANQNPKCKKCEALMGNIPGDFCLGCMSSTRPWSPSWCWFIGEVGNRLPNGQCATYIDTGSHIWKKGACKLHDQYQYDSEGDCMMDNWGMRLKKEKYQRDENGDLVVEGGKQVVRDGILGWTGGKRVEQEPRVNLWPDNLMEKQYSGAWYEGREEGTIDYHREYKWPNYEDIYPVDLECHLEDNPSNPNLKELPKRKSWDSDQANT
ncbi:hypothetical protein NHQ30_002833 [Ciborinia camelliae]|nr:hypothetical protein NHQ30_002833 [Ciborinia camelliae]